MQFQSLSVSLCLLGLVLVPAGAQETANSSGVLRLHPQNHHYFEFQGKPTILVTSAEHYGAVLNRDFDYVTYLQSLSGDGLNYTRIFVGSYVEIPGSFGIQNNTLAPETGRYLSPWRATDQPGAYPGEFKWDLTQWNPEYFARLRSFVQAAQDQSIVVEVTLFCSTYQDSYWLRHPFHPDNNINGLPVDLRRQQTTTLSSPRLVTLQKEMVRKIVQELNPFDNVFYEIQNEPWADNPRKVMRTLRTLDPKPEQGDWYKWAEMGTDESLAWQREMAQVIVDTESEMPKKHLIAQNFTNFKHSLDNVDPNIAILNFHYAWPEAVWMNYGWNRPVSFDESGFAGSDDERYLVQAWQFMLAGGAVFNNLDYSFYVGAEDGRGSNQAPGGGSAMLRRQLRFLREFLEGFDFVQMGPDRSSVVHAPGFDSQAISQPGRQYAVFLHGPGGEWVEVSLPAGKYEFQFVSIEESRELASGVCDVPESQGSTRLQVPPGHTSLGLAIRVRR
ncbi:MAG: hypothetical protein NXI32_13210 [bacterium]|nr:hypothetical protein [bacterium]